jgi:hypothetical protein
LDSTVALSLQQNKMARFTSLLLACALSTAAAFAPQSSVSSSSALRESFGFDFAEDQAENTPSVILGEANYKQWVGEKVDNSFLNRQVSHLVEMMASGNDVVPENDDVILSSMSKT